VSGDWIDTLFRDTGRVELRHELDGRWTAGLFDDAAALRAAVAVLLGRGNLYTSLNAPTPRRCSNRMGGDAPLRNEDMGFLVRIPFDFDPERPSGTASTEDELREAIVARDRLVSALNAMGWPAPALATSGNGAHAVYRWRVPATANAAEALRLIYDRLAIDFSTATVKFDRTVRNAGRIWRLYGSTNRKGTPTVERPHRLAAVQIPQRWVAVSARLIERLAESYARRTIAPSGQVSASTRGTPAPEGAGDYSTLDVAGWFASRGMYRRSLIDGKHAVACPWGHEHSSIDPPHSTATVVWEARGEGWPTFHCSHAHCAGRSIRDVMALWGDADRHCAREWRAAR
jgi:hypothetical protein